MKVKSLENTALEDAALAFAALGSKQRLGVLRALVRAIPEGMSIGDLGKATAIVGATLTHHVRSLTDAGLVDQVKQGRSIICAVNHSRVQGLADFLLEECCANTSGDDTEPTT